MCDVCHCLCVCLLCCRKMGSKKQPPLLPMETPPPSQQYSDDNDATSKVTGNKCLVEERQRRQVRCPVANLRGPNVPPLAASHVFLRTYLHDSIK